MKKIMFNDRYRLTDAVLQGRKTMTRREIVGGVANSMFCNAKSVRYEDGIIAIYSRSGTKTYTNITPVYKVGEVVAVAQSYKDVYEQSQVPWDYRCDEAGWINKMFVRADLMRHQIRIADIRIERLQDISDEDCLRDGVMQSVKRDEKVKEGRRCFWTPREAFATLIDKVSGRGTWQRNPWVFVYEFELVK